MAQRTTLKEFEAVFPKLEADLIEHAESYKLPQKQIDWYKAVGVPGEHATVANIILSLKSNQSRLACRA